MLVCQSALNASCGTRSALRLTIAFLLAFMTAITSLCKPEASAGLMRIVRGI
jgi:hypothetical protein